MLRTSGNDGEVRLSAAHRRHRHLVAPAAWRSTSSQARNCRSLPMQMRTSLSRLRLQVTAIAIAQARIDLDEGILDLGRCHRLRCRSDRRNSVGNFHRRARLADGLEIGPAPSPEQVPCFFHSLKISPGAGIRSSIEVMMLRSSQAIPVAIFGKAVLILRPQPVDHERKRPAAALGLERPPLPRSCRRLAERGRPRQRQHVKIEFAGGVLPAILRRGRSADADQCTPKQQAVGDQKCAKSKASKPT